MWTMMPRSSKLPAHLFSDGIIQAPMAGLTDAAIVIASCQAGILGSLGAGNLEPAAIRTEIKKIRSATDRPFNINLFVVNEAIFPEIPTDELLVLSNYCNENGIDFELPTKFCPSFRDQFHVILDETPAIASFTFGILDTEAINELHKRNIFVIGTATNLLEIKNWQDIGADAVCLQGIEAGGHRGTFKFSEEDLDLFTLLQQATSVAHIPIVAAGGIMDGASIVSCFRHGADAVQLGTAFLCCNEALTPEAYRNKLLSGLTADDTIVTRAFSGRPARGVRNEFIAKFDALPVSPYPIRNALTQPLRKWATQKGDAENMSLWAGTGLAAIRSLGLSELVSTLRREMEDSEGIRHF
jgi:nitronate monooxygenase